MKVLKATLLWAAIAALLVSCAAAPSGSESESEAPDKGQKTTATESETRPAEEPEETGSEPGKDEPLTEDEAKALYEGLGFRVREIKRVGRRFLVLADSPLSAEEGYEPDSVFEVFDPLTRERTYLLTTAGPAADYDVRTDEEGNVVLAALQRDFYGDRMRGRNGRVAGAVESVVNGLRTVDRGEDFFLYPAACPFTVGSVMEESYVRETELKAVRLSHEANGLYLAFGRRGEEAENGTIPAAEIAGEPGEIRVFFPGIGLRGSLAGEHKVETREDQTVFVISWKAEKKEDGVLLTVRTGEAAERVSCHSADVRGRSELFLRLETAGNAFPELSYGDR